MPAISAGGVVTAQSFVPSTTSIAPGSWVEIYGSNLAAQARVWTTADFTGNTAPQSLGGTTVTIGGQSAFLSYVSPTQVNAQVPSNVGTGPQQMTVQTAAGTSAAYSVTVNAVQPSLLSPLNFVVNGRPYLVALLADEATYVLPPGVNLNVPAGSAHPGKSITFYGLGFGAVTPNFNAGQIVSQQNGLNLSFRVFFSGIEASVTYAGLAPGSVGLYQFNVVVPPMQDNDVVPMTFSLGGVNLPQTLYTSVRN